MAPTDHRDEPVPVQGGRRQAVFRAVGPYSVRGEGGEEFDLQGIVALPNLAVVADRPTISDCEGVLRSPGR